MNTIGWAVALVLALAGVRGESAPEAAEPLSALAKMPVKEITVFKDGHAFVLHEGRMPTDAKGNVQMDYLPTPVIGTFWPFSADKNVKLTAVKAASRRVLVEQTALTVAELIEANPGAEVGITDTDGKGYGAHIVGLLKRSSEELEATAPPNTGGKLPIKTNLVLLKTVEGVAVLPVERIKTLTFKGQYKTKLAYEEFRNLLTLKLDWPNNNPARMANVGMLYLQKGIRWIPSYKVTIDGKGNAVVKLQATLLNEMTDLEDVTANLVIGVPSFFFKDTPDPIGLQQTFAQLSQYFQTDSRTGFGMSNGIASQVAGRGGGIGGGGFGPGAGANPDLGPEIGGAEKNEDLFVFTVKHVSLKKGERMVLPITEFPLKYRDIYTVDLPFAPPSEVRGNINSEQQAELARLLNAPKAIHKIRLANKSAYPLTTAPALILNGDKLVGQGLMTYTAVGADVDLALTTAVDVRIKRTEKETQRTPNAEVFQNTHLGRVDMAGTISLTNFRNQAVELEVTRYVLGQVDKADQGGTATMVNAFEDAASSDLPAWWNSYGWPNWWRHFNGVGRFTWRIKVDPNKTVDLGYTWHYFWE